MSEEQTQVKEFHKHFGFTLNKTPTHISEEQSRDRSDILEEEVGELRTALMEKDIVKIADAVADVIYVAKGTAVACGLDSEIMELVFSEVHRSNMTKEKPPGSTGKAIKGLNYSPPDIASIIKNSKR